VVLNLALLASHIDKYATALIENRRQTLAVALFNLCYVLYIVFVRRVKWFIVPLIIVQMDLPVDGVCICSKK